MAITTKVKVNEIYKIHESHELNEINKLNKLNTLNTLNTDDKIDINTTVSLKKELKIEPKLNNSGSVNLYRSKLNPKHLRKMKKQRRVQVRARTNTLLFGL